ncbi:MAG: 16S rRNA (cytidine(1402)-2'-O)-methyltransferase [Pseudomonadota bacterium]|nr:16S rRNA (cytidine(1402)-2'-O)-methyltransferase [Pseudomonadota bacterium]
MIETPDSDNLPTSSETDGAQPSDAPSPSKCSNAKLRPGLYIVATPIGNLSDLTERAYDILATVSLVACEDTRVTGKLLSSRGIRTKLVAYHDHTPQSVRDGLIESLKNGETVALASDAGTPLVSDPGYKLVAAAIEADIHVTAAPGPASPLAALVLSGLPTDRFLFGGYLPSKEKARREVIREFAALRATLIFLESPRRLTSSLSALASHLGDRAASVARELTKVHEEVVRGRLSELAEKYFREGQPRGEVVIVIGPPERAPPDDEDIDTLLDGALSRMSLRDAADAVASATGAPKKYVYRRALEVKRRTASGGE